jgi:hypothetical protein
MAAQSVERVGLTERLWADDRSGVNRTITQIMVDSLQGTVVNLRELCEGRRPSGH